MLYRFEIVRNTGRGFGYPDEFIEPAPIGHARAPRPPRPNGDIEIVEAAAVKPLFVSTGGDTGYCNGVQFVDENDQPVHLIFQVPSSISRLGPVEEAVDAS